MSKRSDILELLIADLTKEAGSDIFEQTLGYPVEMVTTWPEYNKVLKAYEELKNV